MSVLSDLVRSGLSLAQAETVVKFNNGQATLADLVVAGFSSVQASEIAAKNVGAADDGDLARSGFWFGTQVPAIEAALAANTAPVANAGPNQTVNATDEVTLDGSGSFDPNGDVITYAWTLSSKPEGSTATLTGATTVSPTFTADLDGSYVVSLVVSDGTLTSAPDTVTVLATLPVADAGPDQEVEVGEVVTLDGSGSSDATGDTLTYAWTLTSVPESSTATLTGATTVSPTFTADLTGEYVASLVVNDGTNDSAADTVTITATAPEV
jgi:chitinase